MDIQPGIFENTVGPEAKSRASRKLWIFRLEGRTDIAATNWNVNGTYLPDMYKVYKNQ